MFVLTSLCLAALVLGGGQTPAVRSRGGIRPGDRSESPSACGAGKQRGDQPELQQHWNGGVTGGYANPGAVAGGVELCFGGRPGGYCLTAERDRWQHFDRDIGTLPASECCAHIWITALVDASLLEETLLTSPAEISTEAEESNLSNNSARVTSQVCDMGESRKRSGSGASETRRCCYLHHHPAPGATDGNGCSALSQCYADRPAPAAGALLGRVGEPAGTVDGQELRWQGRVNAGEPLQLRYRLGIEADTPAGERVPNRARIQWIGGEMELEPVEVLIYLSDDDHVIGPEGGQWGGCLGIDTQRASEHGKRGDALPVQGDGAEPTEPPPGYVSADRAFEMNAYQFGEVHQFGEPIQMTIRYRQGDVDGILPPTLRLWYRAGPGEPWAMLGEPLQHRNGEITFSTDHFTQFALFGEAGYEIEFLWLCARGANNHIASFASGMTASMPVDVCIDASVIFQFHALTQVLLDG